jgi:hypothetical protein
MIRYFAATLLFAALAAQAAPLPTYRVVAYGADVGTLIHMNNHGDLVGYVESGDTSRAFILNRNGRVWLPENFTALKINDAGVAAGAYGIPGDPGTIRAGFVRNGQLTTIDVGGNYAHATGINARGDLSGTYLTPEYESRAFTYINGTVHILPGFAPGDQSATYDINNAGKVVGNAGPTGTPFGYASAWTASGISHLAHTDFGTATAVNNRGTAVGYQFGSATLNMQGVVNYADGTSTIFASEDENDAIYIYDVNDADLAVGTMLHFIQGRPPGLFPLDDALAEFEDDDPSGLLFIDGTMVDLNDILVPDSGWHISGASTINNAGQILGTGCRAGVCSSVVLTPVPEPSQAALMTAGLLLTAGLARQRRSRSKVRPTLHDD